MKARLSYRIILLRKIDKNARNSVIVDLSLQNQADFLINSRDFFIYICQKRVNIISENIDFLM